MTRFEVIKKSDVLQYRNIEILNLEDQDYKISPLSIGDENFLKILFTIFIMTVISENE